MGKELCLTAVTKEEALRVVEEYLGYPFMISFSCRGLWETIDNKEDLIIYWQLNFAEMDKRLGFQLVEYTKEFKGAA